MGKENKTMRVHLTPDQLEGVRKQANDLILRIKYQCPSLQRFRG